MKQSKAILFLFMANIFWSFSFIPGAYLMRSISSENLLFYRFALGAIVIFIITHKQIFKSSQDDFKAGIILGLCLLLAMFFQNLSFMYTTVSKSAFLANVSMVLVPFLAYFISKSKITRSNIIGLVIAVVGIVILSYNPANFKDINIGDGFALISAVGFALQIVLVNKYSQNNNPYTVAFMECGVIGIVGMGLSLISGFNFDKIDDLLSISSILFLSVICSGVCYIIQAVVAKNIKEILIGIIIASQGVLASCFDVIIYHTPITLQLIGGGLLLSIAIVYLVIKKEDKV
ncbi:MAG: DMT family transporter [Bacilli bacterium]|jgi:drug/metabolite transporter (DMT)-like permease|nr:DMT family transporter [Bacilli bacterium]